MERCKQVARRALEEHLGDKPLSGPDGIKQLLVYQRHLHKKGIMFTVLVFSIVLADLLGIEFVWSSDSDTIVLPESLDGTISTVAGDYTIGGASSGLVVHNAADTVVTKLASTIYWCELYLTRSMPGSMAVSDCQSGPSAVFRLSAISPILIRWYNQRVFGKRMVRLSKTIPCVNNEQRLIHTFTFRLSMRIAISPHSCCFTAGASYTPETS